jgi:hypothetical protein
MRSVEAGLPIVQAVLRLHPQLLDRHRRRDQRLTQQYCPGGVTRSCRLRILQHLGSGKDWRVHQHRQVECVARPRIHRLHAMRAFQLHGGGVGLLHDPIDPRLPDTPAPRARIRAAANW